jgi:hypothetical protein
MNRYNYGDRPPSPKGSAIDSKPLSRAWRRMRQGWCDLDDMPYDLLDGGMATDSDLLEDCLGYM